MIFAISIFYRLFNILFNIKLIFNDVDDLPKYKSTLVQLYMLVN